MRLGWLVVPGFYGDDQNEFPRRASSVSRDVAALLKRFVAEKIDGVVLDFRGNLGGLLDEAIEVGGLFCGRVPIAQVRTPGAEVEVLQPVQLHAVRPLYEGPLVVLTDRGSASASELVAGALQDYGRAIVVGGEQTFGKGSVQATLPLHAYMGSRTRQLFGGMALTIGKFYRVNGQSTQLLGVRPDIVLPSTLDLPNEGEGALVDPLPHDSVAPLQDTAMQRVSMRTLTAIVERSASRVGASEAFAAIAAERDKARKDRRENRLSLEESERRGALEISQRAFSQREASLETIRFGERFSRLLLEDVRQKRLKFSDRDPLACSDPESVTTEAEVLRILSDLVLFASH
jgi:carboxyl-terminal processing protease